MKYYIIYLYAIEIEGLPFWAAVLVIKSSSFSTSVNYGGAEITFKGDVDLETFVRKFPALG